MCCAAGSRPAAMSSSPDGCPVFWFTGLSGAGKTTAAESVSVILAQRGLTVVLFDGDEVRRRPNGSSTNPCGPSSRSSIRSWWTIRHS
ncbi:MAG: adenylyl-sulfate kinase [Proteobacteria bacterium]|nr:adenylyl-sulfate kinase [Pseudomonadota bacterium]